MMAPISVADLRSSRLEHLEHAINSIGRSEAKLEVFKAVYYHKSRVKSVSEIADATGLTRIRVLQAGNDLVKRQIFDQSVKDGEVAYVQDPSFQALKPQILRGVASRANGADVPTKRNPQVTVKVEHRIRGKPPKVPTFVTIDEISSFARVKGRSPLAPNSGSQLSEEEFKEGIKRILGEVGRFKDWGGEQNDLFTTGLVVAGKRRRTAFAFKGPGKKGILRPKHMGKNGDQIKRLFESAADVFLVQYHGQVHESVTEEMELRARLLASDRNSRVWYGVIDGTDSSRLVAAYPNEFVKPPAKRRTQARRKR